MTSPPWQLRPADASAVTDIAASLGCPEPIATILAARGVIGSEALRRFFEPSLADLHPPHLMLGMDRAVARIRQAVTRGESILIYGDYDVDGTIATVLLKTAIERIAPLGTPAQVSWHVPHRVREGYGIQSTRLSEAAAAGVRLVISVDTGIRAFAAARDARALGLDLIVTDHHLTDDAAGVPDALSVINPAQPGCPYPFKSLCGAAVAFKLAHALLLEQAKTAADPARAQTRLDAALLPSFLKLVAIATIADSVPLTGENRTIAALGLRELRNPVQPGLRALLHVADLPLDRSPTAVEVGFRIAPRINAAGRMDVADDVIELFLTRSPERATELATRLNDLNEERRGTERDALTTIDARLADLRSEAAGYPPEPIIVDDAAWHRGVLGILASRIVDRTGRPALVLTHEPPGQAHGSGRSVAGFHLLDALTAAHGEACGELPAAALFTRFGGHAHAVGFSLPSRNVTLLRDRLRRYSGPRLTADVLSPPCLCDAVVGADMLSLELVRWIERCAPFGNAHAEPILLTPALVLSGPVRIIKERHLSFGLVSGKNLPLLQALAWTRSPNDRESWPERAAALGLTTGSRVDLLYRLSKKTNAWFDGLELELVDLRRA